MQKRSHKRDTILDILRSTASHPSAEWVFHQAKQAIPDLSIATVYRNLALFRQQGEIISIATVNGQERFDANTQPHTHFICTACGAVIDIDYAPAEANLESIEKEHGIQIISQFLIFYGVCGHCRSGG
ncbi:MAG: transcriptional repressor [Oscillospiraceae bacterium]|nr:transcriptional repressor [Oscillospiraceae bacterium]